MEETASQRGEHRPLEEERSDSTALLRLRLRTGEYLEALRLVEERLKPYQLWSSVALTLSGVPMLLAGGYVLLSSVAPAKEGILLLLLGVVFVGAGLFGKQLDRLSYSQYRETFAKMRSSKLAARLAHGVVTAESIDKHIPRYWRWLRRRDGDPLQRTVVDILSNSDWFVGPARAFARLGWEMMGIALLGSLLLAVCIPLLAAVGNTTAAFSMIGAVIPLLAAIVFAGDIWSKAGSVKVLRRHLEEYAATLAGVDAAAVELNATDTEPAATGLDQGLGMRMILNQLDIDTRKALMYSSSIPTNNLVWCFAPLTLLLAAGSGAVLPAVAAVAGCTAEYFYLQRWSSSYRSSIAARLEASNLAERIVLADDTEDGIEEHTPVMLRPLLRFPRLPQGYAGSLRERLWMTSFNLEFYLRRPQRYIRFGWFTGIAMLQSLLLFLLLVLSGIAASAPVLIVLCSFIPLAVNLSMWIESARRTIWVEELSAYLRRRLEE